MESRAAFEKSVAYPDFRTLFAPFAEGGGMEHFEMR